ncbi:MAG: Sir2 family NAD-dependent protein deacetylase [Nitriliruptoraceae bacterium]|nr:Sir2 family NAD-dependent protein deacetylase [Nitriliruptoraceae bacterium]
MDATEQELVDDVAAWVRGARQVVVLTGAGVSTASGIPDFRGPKGLWTTQPGSERLFSIDAYLEDPEVRAEVWQRRAHDPAFRVGPNQAHLALAELERAGHLHTLITQNIDGLHQAGGSDPDRVVEIHGTIHEIVCLECDRRLPAEPILERVRAGEIDPRCEACGGLQKSATVSFGQSLDPALLQRAHEAVMGCDVFLAVGSSLVVHPVALLPRTALEVGALLVVVNAEETPYDREAAAVLRSDIPTVLDQLRTTVLAPPGA